MSSKILICNQALMKLGKEPITDFTTTSEGVKINLIFDEIRDHVLAEGPWSSAVKRVALGTLADTPLFGFDYAFELPTDCVRVLSLDEDRPGEIEFRIEGRTLLCDESSINIRYVTRLEDVGAWDQFLKQAVILRLAGELAQILRGDKSLTQMMFAGYRQMVNDGLARDGQQGSAEIPLTSDLTDIRA